MTSLNLNYLSKGLISKYSHIGNYSFKHMNSEGHNSVHNRVTKVQTNFLKKQHDSDLFMFQMAQDNQILLACNLLCLFDMIFQICFRHCCIVAFLPESPVLRKTSLLIYILVIFNCLEIISPVSCLIHHKAKSADFTGLMSIKLVNIAA